MGSLTIEELKALIWQAIQEWNDCNSDHNRCLTSLDIIDHVGHITCQIKPSDLEVEYEGEPLFANAMYLIDFIIGPDSQDDLQDISLSSENPILRNLKVDSANVLDASSSDPILELKCTHSSDHFEDLLAKTTTRGMRDISTISHVCDVVYNTELPTSKIGITTSELLKGVEKMETKRNAEPKSEKTYEFESTTSADEDETDADDPKADHESCISPQDAYKSKYHFTSSGLTHIAKIYKVGATRPDDTQTYAAVDVGELETYGYIEYALNPKAAKYNNLLNGFKLWLVVQNDGDVWLELRNAVGQVKRSVYLDNACEYAPPPKQYRAYRVLPETLDDATRSKVMDALGRAWLTCHAAYSRYPEVRKTHQDAWHYGSYDSDDISYEEFSRHYGIWVDAHDPVWPKFEIMKL